MNYLFLFSLFLIPSFLIAQENTKLKNSFDIVTGVAFGHRIEGEKFIHLKNHPDQAIIFEVHSKPLVTINYHFGINYTRHIIKGLSFRIGSQISAWNLANDVYNYQTKEDVLRMTYLFLEIPLIFQYKFSAKKVRPFIELGGSPAFFLQNKSKGAFIAAPDFSFTLQAGFGVSYEFNKYHSLFVQVLSRFQMFSFGSKRLDFDLYPYEVGIELGTAFHF